jgi:hypothetical protein
MNVNRKLFEAIAKSENLADLRIQRDRAANKPAYAEFVAAIDSRIAELMAGAQADAMSKDYWMLLDEIEKVLHQYLGRTRPMVPKRMKDGMTVREAIVDTVSHLVTADDATEGFKKLATLGRLDLSFESFVLKWAVEFPPLVRAASRTRLNGAGYLATV